jgi:hypothetical protein
VRTSRGGLCGYSAPSRTATVASFKLAADDAAFVAELASGKLAADPANYRCGDAGLWCKIEVILILSSRDASKILAGSNATGSFRDGFRCGAGSWTNSGPYVVCCW